MDWEKFTSWNKKMISKEKIKYIRSLHDKKGREEEGIFLVEGRKSLEELLVSDFETIEFFISLDFYKKHSEVLQNKNYTITYEDDINKISTLKTNDSWVALVRMPERKITIEETDEIILVLDSINDPGNFWTIIRTADWYGIKKIVVSKNTVEAYNPKVIIASMGSFTRVHIFYTDLEKYLENKKNVYWAFLEWEDIHTLKNKNSLSPLYIVIGSESHGISDAIEKYVTNKITIPRFWNTESLNAGIATAIILDNIKRIFKK